MAELAGVSLDHPLMNAAGTCKTLSGVQHFARSAVSAVVVGSITWAERAGNSGTTYWAGDGFALNSLGLPNHGVDLYREQVPEMVAVAHAAGKPLVVSVAGFTAEEYAGLAQAVLAADLIELNLACPNVWDGGRQKRLACFDLEQTERICRLVHEVIDAGGGGSGTPTRRPAFGVKVSPFSDPVALVALAGRLGELAGELDTLRFVIAVNTFPNGTALDVDGRPMIDGGLAGVSGDALKPIGLGQVRQLRAALPDHVDVVGVGGISCGQDMRDYLTAGAVAVQAATVYWNSDERPRVYGEILADYVDGLAPPVPQPKGPR